jgi:hypothetical protein
VQNPDPQGSDNFVSDQELEILEPDPVPKLDVNSLSFKKTTNHCYGGIVIFRARSGNGSGAFTKSALYTSHPIQVK